MSDMAIKHYTLKSKDVSLLNFNLIKKTSIIDNLPYVTYKIEVPDFSHTNNALWPKGLYKGSDKEKLTEELFVWLKSRKAPKNRVFIDKVIDYLGQSKNPLKYIDVTRGLSLNDAFWVLDSNENITWKEVNLYSRQLDEVIANIAFTGQYDERSLAKLQQHRSSPELTSGGALRKCWFNKDSGIFLRKADEPLFTKTDGRSMVTFEFYAAQAAEAMGIPYVPYFLASYVHTNGKSETVCECPLFTSEDVGFVCADDYFRDTGLKITNNDIYDPEFHVTMANIYGFDAYADMMLFDTIILNTDRHLGNFGYLVDNNTGEYLRPAPVFDNGTSSLVGVPTKELEDMPALLRSETCRIARYLDFDDQASIFVQKRHLPALEKLTTLKLHQPSDSCLGVSDSTLHALEYAFRYRSERAIELYYQKRDSLEAKNSLEF